MLAFYQIINDTLDFNCAIFNAHHYHYYDGYGHGFWYYQNPRRGDVLPGYGIGLNAKKSVPTKSNTQRDEIANVAFFYYMAGGSQ